MLRGAFLGRSPPTGPRFCFAHASAILCCGTAWMFRERYELAATRLRFGCGIVNALCSYLYVLTKELRNSDVAEDVTVKRDSSSVVAIPGILVRTRFPFPRLSGKWHPWGGVGQREFCDDQQSDYFGICPSDRRSNRAGYFAFDRRRLFDGALSWFSRRLAGLTLASLTLAGLTLS